MATIKPHHELCPITEPPSIVVRIVDCGLLVAIIGSYVPQYHRIIHRASSDGISPLFILLGFMFSAASLANAMAISYSVLQCCRNGSLHGFRVFRSLLGVLQLGTQFLCFTILLVVYLHYTVGHSPSSLCSVSQVNLPRSLSMQSIAIALISLLFTLAILVPTLTACTGHPPQNPGEGIRLALVFYLVSYASTILSLIQYIPQIFLTYERKSFQSLSPAMLALQIPTFLALAISLASRWPIPRMARDHSSGFIYVFYNGGSAVVQFALAGCLSGALIALGFWRGDENELPGTANERTPLLTSLILSGPASA